jgi:hypothetical protein
MNDGIDDSPVTNYSVSFTKDGIPYEDLSKNGTSKFRNLQNNPRKIPQKSHS